MSAVEFLARDYKFFASEDGQSWTEIGGINTWKWTEDTELVDVTDFDDEGWKAELSAQKGAVLGLEGNRLRDPETGERDAGQAMVEVASRKFGFAGLLYFKVQTRDEIAGTPPVPFGTIVMRGTPKLNEAGGGAADKAPWGCEVSSYGKPTFTGEFAGE